MPQKIHPKNESNKELIKANRSEKKGITSAMMNPRIQRMAKIPAQVAHPITVFCVLCFESRKMRKKTKRAETEEYKTPRKIRVGIMKLKATFM